LKKKTASGIILTQLICILILVSSLQPMKATSLSVHNIDTGEDFAAIHEMLLDWNLTYNPSPYPDIPRDVAVDSQDNIIVVGQDSSTPGHDPQWRILKFNKSGSLLYNENYDTPGGFDMPHAVAVDSQDYIIVVGTDDTFEGEPIWKIMKLKPDLTEEWEITKDFPPAEGYNYRDVAYDVAIDKFDLVYPDSIIVVGYDEEYGSDKAKWRVIKFDKDGNVIWDKPFDPNPDEFDVAYGVAIQHLTRHMIVVGTAVPTGETRPDWGMKKLDPDTGDLLDSDGDGTPDCDKIIPVVFDEYDVPYAVAVDSSNNIYVVGYEGGFFTSKWRIMKFDADCNPIWTWNPPVDWSPGSDIAESVAVDSDDNIIVVGYDEGGDDHKWRIIKLDGDKNILMDKTVNPLPHIDSYEAGTGVAVLEGKNIVVVGSDDGDAPDDDDRQWRVVKFACPRVRLIGIGWGRMRIEPREYVYGPARLYDIEDGQIELVVTFESKDYSRVWNITSHRERRYSEKYLCYSKEWGFLVVGLHEHRKWQFWHATGRGAIAAGFEKS
jgi:hypothetical protein